ncbi:MAG: hypothetical protein JF609_01870 [Verrucomicrobia bacterium]|nr:hypothetical protein [Verrucomicrobiota bacterium]
MDIVFNCPNCDQELAVDQSGAGSQIAAKGEKKIRIHTIRRAQCIESGHDKFDEVVSKYLQDVGEANITSLHTINYEQFDVGTQKIMTDYGILIVYRG